MDLVDHLDELKKRVRRQKESVKTEEATKTAFVLPFLRALGYDIFNPDEIIPELTADHGVKKDEKVDYAIKQDGKITTLIECKPVGANLNSKCLSQLFRYFSVTDAQFGILTDGIRYLFYSDLEKENTMDDRPFFEFDVLDFTEDEVEEIKKFTKSAFDPETIMSTASNLKYHRSLISEIRSEFESPSEDLVRLLTPRVYDGRFTQPVKEQFEVLCRNAMKDFLNEHLNKVIKSATEDLGSTPPIELPVVIKDEDVIVTSEEEFSAHRIIQAIAAEVVDPSRVFLRDAKSYCAILFDDNNRKPICRLRFLKSVMRITIFAPGKIEEDFDLDRVEDIYKYQNQIRSSIKQYLD